MRGTNQMAGGASRAFWVPSARSGTNVQSCRHRPEQERGQEQGRSRGALSSCRKASQPLRHSRIFEKGGIWQIGLLQALLLCLRLDASPDRLAIELLALQPKETSHCNIFIFERNEPRVANVSAYGNSLSRSTVHVEDLRNLLVRGFDVADDDRAALRPNRQTNLHFAFIDSHALQHAKRRQKHLDQQGDMTGQRTCETESAKQGQAQNSKK